MYRHTWVNDLRQRADGTWDVITDKGEIHAEHIVNAGGLWAREVGRMIGLELPVLGMEHMYLVTEDMAEVAEHNAATGHEMPMALDFAGEIYIRQEGRGMLLGTYEQACVPWSPRQAPWSFDMELLPPDLDRIAPSLEIAFKHYPAMADAGIKRIVNGPFTFAPDGNPLVGPIRGVRNCWVACAVMAGLSQGGGVGLTLANWMTTGDPQLDIWGMDVASFGDWATWRTRTPRCGRTTAAGSGSRSRTRSSPPAGRCTRPRSTTGSPSTTPCGAPGSGSSTRCGSSGLARNRSRTSRSVVPTPSPSSPRSAAPVRERVGLTECSNFAKYRVTGAGSADWLQGLFTNRLPEARPHRADGDAQPGWADRRRVLRRPDRRRRVLPVRLAGGRGAPLAVGSSPISPTTDRLRGARALAGRAVRRRPTRPRRAAVGDRRVAGDGRLPVHDVPADRHRHDPAGSDG